MHRKVPCGLAAVSPVGWLVDFAPACSESQRSVGWTDHPIPSFLHEADQAVEGKQAEGRHILFLSADQHLLLRSHLPMCCYELEPSTCGVQPMPSSMEGYSGISQFSHSSFPNCLCRCLTSASLIFFFFFFYNFIGV